MPALLWFFSCNGQLFSQPIPSLSESKLCGSGGRTVKLRCSISLQSRSGGGEGMQTVG